jgi:hypothetical protein
MADQILILNEPLTIEEELDFVEAMYDAVDRGDLTAEEVAELISREFDLLFGE